MRDSRTFLTDTWGKNALSLESPVISLVPRRVPFLANESVPGSLVRSYETQQHLCYRGKKKKRGRERERVGETHNVATNQIPWSILLSIVHRSAIERKGSIFAVSIGQFSLSNS